MPALPARSYCEPITSEPARLKPESARAEHAPAVDIAVEIEDGYQAGEPPNKDSGKEMPDAGRVWDVYRDEATESDHRMLSGWNKTLDILLIFAGVFSAVATAFIVESNDQLRPDWNEYTARLLYSALADQLRPGSGNGTVGLDPDTFAAIPASTTSRWISGLWVFSLAISLVVALFCILAKQWLIEYHARVFGSVRSAQQWCRRRTLFFTGMEQWRFPILFAALPALLHLSLFLFMFGLVLFFWTIHRAVATCLLATTCSIVIFYISPSFLTFHDVSCPFYIPLFHPLHNYLGHIYDRTPSFARYLTHVTDAIKTPLEVAMLAWLSATTSEQDVLEVAVSATFARFTCHDALSSEPHQCRPNPNHFLQLLEALRVVDCAHRALDPRMDTALVILAVALSGPNLDEDIVRKHVDALSGLCAAYQNSGIASDLSVPSSIAGARYDAIALLSHIAVHASHYSLSRIDVLVSVLSRIWSPILFDGDPKIFQWMPVEWGNIMTPVSTFVASPAFLAVQWTEDDTSFLAEILTHPLPDLIIGGKALLNLLHVAVTRHAAFLPILKLVECIRINAAAGINILSSSTDQFHPWRQLCCTLDAPTMTPEDRTVLAPLLLECAIALGVEIWRQHTGTDSSAHLTRELLDARSMAPILRSPFLAPHRREHLSYRSRTTGKHSAEHLFLNIMPFLVPAAWHAIWEDVLANAKTDEQSQAIATVLQSIDVRLRSVPQHEHTEVVVPSAVHFTSEAFPSRIRTTRL